jgi:hypothetical protein
MGGMFSSLMARTSRWPDTPQNQASYPQPEVQRPGIGFPLARLTVLLSLATAACHEACGEWSFLCVHQSPGRPSSGGARR